VCLVGEHNLSDKKEVLEYLRNKQKAAEINAKVNGINLWVLLGAIALTLWQLTNFAGAEALSHAEVVVPALLLAEAAYFLTWFMGPSSSHRKEVRFSSWRPQDVESPFLLGTFSFLIVLPPAASMLILGASFSGWFLGIFGVALLVASLAGVLARFSESDDEIERFPKPNFGLSARADVITDIIFGFLFLAVAAVQIRELLRYPEIYSVETLRPIGLLVVLYWLSLIAIQRKVRSLAIGWTYELETDLVLGVVTPEVALRRIEHRALGPRLQDVLDRFFDQLDRKFESIDVALKDCVERLCSVEGIPKEYAAERAARIAESRDMVAPLIEGVIEDCRDFKEYLGKLDGETRGRKPPELITLMPVLLARHEEYRKRAAKAKQELDRAVQGIAK